MTHATLIIVSGAKVRNIFIMCPERHCRPAYVYRPLKRITRDQRKTLGVKSIRSFFQLNFVCYDGDERNTYAPPSVSARRSRGLLRNKDKRRDYRWWSGGDSDFSGIFARRWRFFGYFRPAMVVGQNAVGPDVKLENTNIIQL